MDDQNPVSTPPRSHSARTKIRLGTNLALALALTATIALLPGCDTLEMGALKTYMALKKGLRTSDGGQRVQSAAQTYELEALLDTLKFPWGMAFLPDGDILITEKAGQLYRFSTNTRESQLIDGAPATRFIGQGGLMGVAVHPNFNSNQWVYLSYLKEPQPGKYTTAVSRFTLKGDTLTQAQQLFEATPALEGVNHFGGALLMDNSNNLYISMGDRKQRHEAQNLASPLGKILRLTEDGQVPADNPYANNPNAWPGVYSIGHRNPQGLTINRKNGHIWAAEHGPKGGDEVNTLLAGRNYGWPVISHGKEYSGGEIGEGAFKDGMEQPDYFYVPSIATAGLAYYNSPVMPAWQNNLLVAGLRSFSLSRLTLKDNKVVSEERLLEDFGFRLRAVEQGPDGMIYLLSENGGLLRIGPVR